MLRERLQDAGLDALLLTQPENVRYLTGFSGSLARLLVSREACYLIVDARYAEQASRETSCAVVLVMGSLYEEATAEAVRLSGARRLGFESGELSYWSHGRLEVLLSGYARLLPSGGEVEPLRLLKDASECDALRRAGRITAEAMHETMSLAKAGMTERELAGEFESRMRRKGGGNLSFPTLVGSAERSALPHPEPTDRAIAPGDLVLIDGGTTVDGYHADMTRTFVLGAPTPRQRAALEAVGEALETAIALIRPGMPLSRVVKAARSVLERHGLGTANPLTLGHGVGLALHEEPWLVEGEVGALQAGMVIALEPGIYLSGWGGIRLEELILVGARGPERLTALEGRPLALFPAAKSC
jgi:Xaa-Pro aminopeptidase